MAFLMNIYAINTFTGMNETIYLYTIAFFTWRAIFRLFFRLEKHEQTMEVVHFDFFSSSL